MDWKSLLADLKSRGWTQERIAAHVGAKQSTISDLKTGRTLIAPRHDIAERLKALHAQTGNNRRRVPRDEQTAEPTPQSMGAPQSLLQEFASLRDKPSTTKER